MGSAAAAAAGTTAAGFAAFVDFEKRAGRGGIMNVYVVVLLKRVCYTIAMKEAVEGNNQKLSSYFVENCPESPK